MSDAKSFGNVLLGVLFATTGYGITSLQTYLYAYRFRSDSVFVKSVVYSLLLLDTAHIGFSWHVVYYYLVKNYGNPIALEQTVWSFNMTVFLTVIITLITQCFFIRRVYILSDRNLLLVGTILVLSLVRTVFGFIFAARIWQLQYLQLLPTHLVPLLSTGLGSGAAADFLIAISLVYFFQRGRTGFSTTTDNILDRLTFYTVNNGLLTSIFGLVVVITFATIPKTLVYMASHFMLSKLYANSLLGTLNFRENRDKNEVASGRRSAIHLSSLFHASAFRAAQIHGTPVVRVETTVSRTSDGDLHALQNQYNKDKNSDSNIFNLTSESIQNSI